MNDFDFVIHKRLGRARTGTISTPHGQIQTPAFIPVATQATLKSVTPEQLAATGAQAVLANAYHLYLRPGSEIIDQANGLSSFMNWTRPTFSDSGGFQIMSLGSGFKKVVDMEIGMPTTSRKERLAWIDDEGVTFKSHIDGSRHRFDPEISMRIQHEIGADIIFAFDELTTLQDSRAYQEHSLRQRTRLWAQRSLIAHQQLSKLRVRKPYQALFGVIQGAQYEDLRRESARFLSNLEFDGFGLGGAFTKHNLGEIVSWMVDELPEAKPRHMLGISEPNDIFDCIANGADTFDCVSPARVGRNGALYLPTGRINITNQKYRTDHQSLDTDCCCYTCQNYSRAYLHHLFKSGELLSNTLATIHNEQFIVRLVDNIRKAIENHSFEKLRGDWLSRYYQQ